MNKQTFYYALGGLQFEVFSVGRCENCERFTRENSQTIHHNFGEPGLRAMGLTKLGFLPHETYYSEEEDSEVCPECDPENGAAEDESKPSLKDSPNWQGIKFRLKALGFSESNISFVLMILEYLYANRN